MYEKGVLKVVKFNLKIRKIIKTVMFALLLSLIMFFYYQPLKANAFDGTLSDYIKGEQEKEPPQPDNENNYETQGEEPYGWRSYFHDETQTDAAPFDLEKSFDEQLKASGADRLWDDMPDDTRQIINDIGVSALDTQSFEGLTPKGISDSFMKSLAENAGGPLKTGGMLLGIILIYAYMSGLKETVKGDSLNKLFGVICALASCVILIFPITQTIERVGKALNNGSIFMLSFVPIYSGVLITSGQAATALSYQSVVLFVSEILSMLTAYFILPLMTVSLAMGLTGALTPDYKLDKAGGLINKACGWVLGIISTVFVGLLSIKGIVTSAADSLSNRAIKFSIGSFVPVVGGAMSEAFDAVRGCLNLLKSTVGAVGVLVNAIIVIPPIIECVMWLIVLSFCAGIADMFAQSEMTATVKVTKGVISTMIAVMACSSLFMIIATTIVVKAGGGL